MNELYSELADVYEAMYNTFIDYNSEYEFYSKKLKKWKKNSVLEIGVGTGNLISYFEKNGFDYYGLELNQEMLNLAIKKNPHSFLMQGDMRSFQLNKSVDSVIITGRTISYLQTNEDVNSTFRNVYENLVSEGLLCFDFIDANRFISKIYNGKEISHEANYNKIKYVRKSKWKANLSHGMSFDWESIFFKEVNNELVEIGTDDSTIRTFTKDEIEIFLSINDFTVKEMIDKESYAFPTYAITAVKN